MSHGITNVRLDQCATPRSRTGLAPSKLEWPPGSATIPPTSSQLTFIGGDGARNDDYDRKGLTQVCLLFSVLHYQKLSDYLLEILLNVIISERRGFRVKIIRHSD